MQAISLPFAFAIAVATVGLIVGVWYSFRVLTDVEGQLASPSGASYTVAVARFPDALILQFGLERQFYTVPRNASLSYVPWGQIIDHLNKRIANIAYVNRRMAGQAMLEDPTITIREKTLCIYRGFSICVADCVPRYTKKRSSPRHQRRDIAYEILLSGCILVQEGTDQEFALRAFLADLELEPNDHICLVRQGDDVLDLAISRILEAKPNDSPGERGGLQPRQVIGFAAGITERVVAEKIGFKILAEQPVVLPSYMEINSFVYKKPAYSSHAQDLVYTLEELEILWEETVDRILSDPATQEEFRVFLNQQLYEKLGPGAQARLRDNQLFSSSDVSAMLQRWLEFPSHGNTESALATAPVIRTEAIA